MMIIEGLFTEKLESWLRSCSAPGIGSFKPL